MAVETAAQRYVRDEKSKTQGRKTRDFDNQTAERRNRTYVNAATGTTTSSTADALNPLTPN